MKRLIISLSLFIIILIGCIVEIVFLNDTINVLNQEIEETVKEVNDNDIESAIDLNENVYEKWQEKQVFISTFIDHSKLEQIDQNLLRMKTNLIEDQIEDFHVDSELAKSELNSLKDLELPLIQNIL